MPTSATDGHSQPIMSLGSRQRAIVEHCWANITHRTFSSNCCLSGILDIQCLLSSPVRMLLDWCVRDSSVDLSLVPNSSCCPSGPSVRQFGAAQSGASSSGGVTGARLRAVRPHFHFHPGRDEERRRGGAARRRTEGRLTQDSAPVLPLFIRHDLTAIQFAFSAAVTP